MKEIFERHLNEYKTDELAKIIAETEINESVELDHSYLHLLMLKTGVNEISRKRVNFYKELLTSMDYQIAQKEVVTLLDMIELIDVNKSNDFQEKLFKAAETRDNIWNRIKSKYFKN